MTSLRTLSVLFHGVGACGAYVTAFARVAMMYVRNTWPGDSEVVYTHVKVHLLMFLVASRMPPSSYAYYFIIRDIAEAGAIVRAGSERSGLYAGKKGLYAGDCSQ